MATKDIYFSIDGDILFGEDNTIKIASSNNNELFVSQIYRRLLSRSSDWQDPNVICANLNDFFGLQINQFLLNQIKQRIFDSLVSDNLMQPGDFNINVFLVNTSNVIIALNVLKTTDENSSSLPIRLNLNTSQNRLEGVPLYYDETLIFSNLEDWNAKHIFTYK